MTMIDILAGMGRVRGFSVPLCHLSRACVRGSFRGRSGAFSLSYCCVVSQSDRGTDSVKKLVRFSFSLLILLLPLFA